MTFAEVEVFNEANENVVFNKDAKISSVNNTATSAKKGVDGEKSGRPDSLVITQNRGCKLIFSLHQSFYTDLISHLYFLVENWEVDFGREVNVTRVVIYNSDGTSGFHRYRISDIAVFLLRGAEDVGGYKIGTITTEAIFPIISSSFKRPDFIRLGNWRLSQVCSTCDTNHFSISTRLNFKDSFSVMAGDGTVLGDKFPYGYHGWAYNSTTGPTFSGSGVVFGDHAVQIGNWRLRQMDYNHLSLSSDNGRVSRIFRSDGKVLPPNDDYNGFKYTLGNPTCSFLSNIFLQIGDWRIGVSQNGSTNYISVAHSVGISVIVYQHQGSVHMKSDPGLCTWKSTDHSFVGGSSQSGCRSVSIHSNTTHNQSILIKI